jgi:hypothetical protein
MQEAERPSRGEGNQEHHKAEAHMTCPTCGKEIPEGTVCPTCGPNQGGAGQKTNAQKVAVGLGGLAFLVGTLLGSSAMGVNGGLVVGLVSAVVAGAAAFLGSNFLGRK